MIQDGTLISPLRMLPYPPETVPVVWWRKSGLLPRTAPDSVANLNQKGTADSLDLVLIK